MPTRREFEPLQRVPQIARLLGTYAVCGVRALEVACEGGRLGLARWVDRTWRLPSQWPRKKRFISTVCANGHHRTMLWLGRRFSLSVHDFRGCDSLWFTARNGHVRVLYAFLQRYSSRRDLEADRGISPECAEQILCGACMGGHVGAAEWCWERGMRMMKQQRRDVIQDAWERLDLPMLQWVVDAFDCDPNDFDPQSSGYLEAAAAIGSIPVARYLTEFFAFYPEDAEDHAIRGIIVACKHDHLPLVKWLAAHHGLDRAFAAFADCRGKWRMTEEAARCGSNSWRWVALRAAAEGHHTETARWVLNTLVLPFAEP